MNSVASARLLIVTGIFPPDIGGPATYVPALASFMHTLGHNVTVVTQSDEIKGAEHTAWSFKVVRISRRLPKPLRFVVSILNILRKGAKANLLLSNGMLLEVAIANLILRKTHCVKVVGDWAWERASSWGWTSDDFDVFQNKRQAPVVELMKRVRGFCVRRAAKVITPSKYLREVVVGWGVDSRRIEVIYNGVEVTRNGSQRDLGPRKGTRFLTVCRLVPCKGVDGIIKAVGEVQHAQLFVVGSGPERAGLEELARSVPGGKIRFVGMVPTPDVDPILMQGDVFVLNSTIEAFPHVVVQALLCGLPVVASRVGGVPEIVKHGHNGLLVPPRSPRELAVAMKRMSSDVDLRRSMARNAPKSAEKFSIDNMLHSTGLLLRRLTSG